MKASEWLRVIVRHRNGLAPIAQRFMASEFSAAEDRAEKAERERNEARKAYSREYTANLDLSLRVEQMRGVLEDTAYSVHRNASHSGEFEECRENGCNQIIDILSIPPGSAAREVLEALRNLVSIIQEALGRFDDRASSAEQVEAVIGLGSAISYASALLSEYGVKA